MNERLISTAVLGVAAAATLGLHGVADQARDLEGRNVILVAPSGKMLDVATLDYRVAAADLLWADAVLEFGHTTVNGLEPTPELTEWLGLSILAIMDLDPNWRTPPFYGASILRVVGRIDLSNQVLERACLAFPEDPYFPFSIGMNHYIHLGDAVTAAEWVEKAAALPDAPGWYAATAKALRVDGVARRDAVHHLELELQVTTDPELREWIIGRIKKLVHEEQSEQLTALARERGATTLDALVRSGVELPEDPFGEGWVVDVEGDVISKAQAQERLEKHRNAERAMLTWTP